MSETQNYVLAEKDYMSGMKYKDIAIKYGVTINTVKSWKTRYRWNKKGVHTKSEKVRTQKRTKHEDTEKPIAEEVEQVIENSELTDKQKLFCVIYIRCFNATKAYQRAYKVDYCTALAAGPRLLGNVRIRNEIQRLKQGRLNREMLDETDIFQKYMDIAFADITDYVTFGTEETPVITMYGPVKTEDEETGKKKTLTQNVSVIRLRESNMVDGTIITEVKQGRDGVSIKLADKMKALNWLANHMDLATEEQKARIAILKAKVQDDEGEVQDDGFIDALKGMVSEIWEE